MPVSALQKTTLNSVHAALGATLVDFGGWEMPLWYKTGAVKEHLAVILAAGLFDVSHMAVVLAEGPGIRAFLNTALTRDIADLRLERAAYGIILNEQGHALDDTIIYPLAEDRFGLVVNAGMAARVIAHLKALPGGSAFTWRDLTGNCAKIDIQGPASYRILRPFIADADTVFAQFPYFSFQGDFDFAQSRVRLTDGTPLMLSRTGYTGEFGFELFLPTAAVVSFWHRILAAGGGSGLIPCGLAARDSLRTGAVLPLSHQDIGPWPFINNPWPWALPLKDDGSFSKTFVGSAALDPGTADHTLAFAGFDPRKVEQRAEVIHRGEAIGTVLTCVADVAIGRPAGENSPIVSLADPARPAGWNPRGLVCGFVKVARRLDPGATVTLKDGRREITVQIVSDIRPLRSARKALKL
jgi:aminomethyltransferase